MPLTFIKQEDDKSHFKIKHFQPPSFWPLRPSLIPSKAQKGFKLDKTEQVTWVTPAAFQNESEQHFQNDPKKPSTWKFFVCQNLFMARSHDRVNQMGQSARSRPVLLAALILFAVPWSSC